MKFVFNHARYDPLGIKKTAYKIIDLNPFKSIPRVRYLSYNFDLEDNEKYLNTNHKEWYNPDNPKAKSHESFFDLYDKVTTEASIIINELYEYIFNNKKVNIDKIVGNNSYANGLELPKPGD